MKNTKNLFCLTALLLGIAVFYWGCSPDNPYWNYNSEIPYAQELVVRGQVTDEANTPISGVTVSFGTLSVATTNDMGMFVLDKVIAIRGRVVIEARKAGFFDKTHSFTANVSPALTHVILNTRQTQLLPSSGGLVQMDGASVSLPPSSSFVKPDGQAYNGALSVSYTYLPADNPNIPLLMPGGDMRAVDAEGDEKMLISYGAMGVEITGAGGEALQLGSGQTATISMEVPNSLLADAPATIPLWYFDEAQQLWVEEGSATLSGNTYTGTVSHFSWWNCDVPASPNAFVEGTIVGCEGELLPNYPVSVGPVVVYTDEVGHFITNVPADLDFNVTVYIPGGFSVAANIVAIVPNNSTVDIGTLTVGCFSSISGTLSVCDGTGFGTIFMGAHWPGGNSFSIVGPGETYTLYAPQGVEVYVNALLFLGSSFYTADSTINNVGVDETLNLVLCDNNTSCSGNATSIATPVSPDCPTAMAGTPLPPSVTVYNQGSSVPSDIAASFIPAPTTNMPDYTFIVSNENGTMLGSSADGSFDFSTYPAGTYYFTGVAYNQSMVTSIVALILALPSTTLSSAFGCSSEQATAVLDYLQSSTSHDIYSMLYVSCLLSNGENCCLASAFESLSAIAASPLVTLCYAATPTPAYTITVVP